MRVYVKTASPVPLETGDEIPIWDRDGSLAGHALVVLASNNALIIDLPDDDAGRMMFEDLARESSRMEEVNELERLLQL